MAGNAMLTMKRSRLATNTPTETIAATLVRCIMQRNLACSLYDATVLPNTYRGQNCSIAAALELVGERWTLLILRDPMLGTRRSDDFHPNLALSRNVLQAPLDRLCP